MRNLIVVFTLSLLFVGCKTDTWQVNAGGIGPNRQIRTICKGNSCKTYINTDRVGKCKRDELRVAHISSGWMSQSIKVCPAYFSMKSNSTSRSIASTYTAKLASKFLPQGYTLNLEKANSVEIVESTKTIQCKVEGNNAGVAEFILDKSSKTVSLNIEVDSAHCYLPKDLNVVY